MSVETLEITNEEILEQMLEAEDAPEPGTLGAKRREIIHRGDDETPVQMVRTALKSAGYAYIYDTQTGDRSITNRNMLPAQLQKKRDDGSRIFSTRPPVDAKGRVIRPKQGTIKCLLHPDLRKDHPEYDEMGLPTCPKATLKSTYQRTLHMKWRHKEEWAAIEEIRQQEEKAAERAFQQTVLAAAGAGARKRGKGDEG